MKKRALSALLSLVLLITLAVPAVAADTVATESEAAQVLAALDIMTGDESGDLNLSGNVTRAQFTKLVIAASVYAESVGPTASVAPYPDVPKNNWAAPYIQVAQEKGLIKGYLDGNFRPTKGITLVEGVSMVLTLLGYEKADFSGAWGSGQMAMYHTLKLDRGITAGQNDALTRQDCLYLFYNLLTAKTKSGQVYLTTLGHTLTASGEIDRVALINSAMEGPVVAASGWEKKVPFDTNKATVYRGGTLSTLSAIQEEDVVYWSKSMRTLWAYSNKVTGILQAITPSASAPAGVTVSGRSYTIETSEATYDLSDLGTYRLGDNVTLLLGRDGGVAAVRGATQAMDTIICGIVTKTDNQSFVDKEGKSYSAPAVTFTATDGKSYTYQWENWYDGLVVGDLIRVDLIDGSYKVTEPSVAKLNGTVSSDATKLGSYTLADNVEILDTYSTTNVLQVYPFRLAGITLTDAMVRYYTFNSLGQIDRLILNDVTGDLHLYGILTDVSESATTNLMFSNYTYNVAGTTVPFITQDAIWNLKKGPCQVKSDNGTVKRIYNISEVALYGIDGNQAKGDVRTYTVADNVAVYELRDKKYYLTDLARVTGGGYTLTGAYDKSESEGGRIRVIIAVAK